MYASVLSIRRIAILRYLYRTGVWTRSNENVTSLTAENFDHC
jgi:hypothetical protein